MNRNNNFDLLRLLFASAVIISHSPLLIDGTDSQREPLRSIFETVDLGSVAVEGFFLISGYLITKSYEDATSVPDYLLRRILRIYPGFLVAYFVSFFLVGWLGGGEVPALFSIEALAAVAHALALHAPEVPNAFADLPVPSVNGSMWTISYEFRCYLLVALCGVLGLLRHRGTVLVLAALLLGLSMFDLPLTPPRLVAIAAGNVEWLVAFTAYFLVGSLFYLFRDCIPYRGRYAALAAAALLALLFVPMAARPAVAVFGGYLTFWFALSVRSRLLDGMRPRHDISYGLYLYGWPVQILLIDTFRDLSPWAVSAAALAIAGLLGALSWVGIERPALRLKGKPFGGALLARWQAANHPP